MTFIGSLNHFYFKLYSKPHTFSTFFGEEKESKMHLLSPKRPLRTEQNARKVKRSKIQKKWVKRREF